jgi:tetratricopeptide (TPR) repeat protein
MGKVEKAIRGLVIMAALLSGLTIPTFAQTQQAPSSTTPAVSAAPPTSGGGQDYATERATALEMRRNSEFLKSLPLFEELYAKNQNDIPVLEGLTEALLARGVTQADPTLANKDRMRARDVIEHARSLGDHSQLVENLWESLKDVDEKSTVTYSAKAEADTAMKAGEAAFAKRDFDEAIKNYKRAIELDPSNYYATLFVGDSYFALKQFPAAGEWYTKAEVLDPNQDTAFRYHGDMLTKQGDLAGARSLLLQGIVASPYDPKTWRALVAWAKPAGVTLQRVHIEAGTSVTPTDKGANITFDPSQPAETGAIWIAYAGSRALWKDKFKQTYPKEAQYRHSLAEEVEALTTAAKVAEEQAGKKGSKALDSDANVQLLLKLYHADLLAPYVLLNGADQGISEDYVAYRAQNRAKLIQYLGEFVAPEPAATKTAAN